MGDTEDRHDPARFDPAAHVSILELPEGKLTRSLAARLLMRDQRAYDPLWRYVRKVDPALYRGQRATVRFGEYDIGLRAPNRVPAWIDFGKQVLYLGLRLTIPFSSLRGLMVGHGMMPHRKFPVFALLIKVDGCDQYLPVHQCVLDESVTDLADFLSARMRVPLGIASRPLGFLVRPGGSTILHSGGETPLYQVRSLLTIRTPDGRTRVSILGGPERTVILDQPDPLGWLEGWGIVAGELVSVVARRVRSRYGRGE
jgi:hypothetical protein